MTAWRGIATTTQSSLGNGNAATDWGIDGTLLDADGLPLDPSNATLSWS